MRMGARQWQRARCSEIGQLVLEREDERIAGLQAQSRRLVAIPST